jgi:outer membrane protein
MKKSMRKILLLVAVVAANASHAQSQQAAGRVGYANIQYIITQLPDSKRIETELKSTQTQFKTQIDAKSEQLKKAYADFNANMNTMPDSVKMRKQQELQTAMADLEKFQQEAQTTLQNKQKLFMAPLYLKVSKVIGDVAKENGYTVILTQQLNNYRILLYQKDQEDVSNLVLKKMGVTPTTPPPAK